MAEPGGVTVEHALDCAAVNLARIESACLAAIDQKIALLSSSVSDDAAIEQAYRLSNDIFAESGTFGLLELSAVAHNLCGLLSSDVCVTSDVISIHVEAMRALRSSSIASSKTKRTAILCELRALAAKLSRST